MEILYVIIVKIRQKVIIMSLFSLSWGTKLENDILRMLSYIQWCQSVLHVRRPWIDSSTSFNLCATLCSCVKQLHSRCLSSQEILSYMMHEHATLLSAPSANEAPSSTKQIPPATYGSWPQDGNFKIEYDQRFSEVGQRAWSRGGFWDIGISMSLSINLGVPKKHHMAQQSPPLVSVSFTSPPDLSGDERAGKLTKPQSFNQPSLALPLHSLFSLPTITPPLPPVFST